MIYFISIIFLLIIVYNVIDGIRLNRLTPRMKLDRYIQSAFVDFHCLRPEEIAVLTKEDEAIRTAIFNHPIAKNFNK